MPSAVRLRRSLAVTCVAVLAAGARGQEGGIEVFAGETLFASGLRLSFTEIYKRRDDLYFGTNTVSDALNQRTDEYRTVLAADYGVLPDVTLTALLPAVHRELRSGAQRFRATGMGDAAVIAKYRVLKIEGRQTGFNWAWIGGLETPTGRTGVRDDGVLLAPSMQPGTGAWNPFLATAVTYGLGRSRLDTAVFYKLNTEGAQSFRDGDFLSVHLGAGYRFIHVRYPGPTVGVHLGLDWRHEGRAEQSGVKLANSGADELLLQTGLVAHPKPNLDLSLKADFPVYLDYEGTQLGRDLTVSLSFGVRF